MLPRLNCPPGQYSEPLGAAGISAANDSGLPGCSSRSTGASYRISARSRVDPVTRILPKSSWVLSSR
jgi:hypothetical protein